MISINVSQSMKAMSKISKSPITLDVDVLCFPMRYESAFTNMSEEIKIIMLFWTFYLYFDKIQLANSSIVMSEIHFRVDKILKSTQMIVKVIHSVWFGWSHFDLFISHFYNIWNDFRVPIVIYDVTLWKDTFWSTARYTKRSHQEVSSFQNADTGQPL